MPAINEHLSAVGNSTVKGPLSWHIFLRLHMVQLVDIYLCELVSEVISNPAPKNVDKLPNLAHRMAINDLVIL